MIERNVIDELFRCLLAGVATTSDGRTRFDQTQRLISAFDQIDDTQLRQELILLVEIVSKMPEVLQHKRESWGKTKLSQVH